MAAMPGRPPLNAFFPAYSMISPSDFFRLGATVPVGCAAGFETVAEAKGKAMEMLANGDPRTPDRLFPPTVLTDPRVEKEHALSSLVHLRCFSWTDPWESPPSCSGAGEPKENEAATRRLESTIAMACSECLGGNVTNQQN